MLKYLAKKN